MNREFVISGDLEEGGSPVPVSQFRVLFIEGGFLLFVYLHHSYTDASGLDKFLGYVASATYHTSPTPPTPNQLSHYDADRVGHNCDVQLPTDTHSEGRTFDQLLTECAEYGLLPEPRGPTQPISPPINLGQGQSTPELAAMKGTGKIYVFKTSVLSPIRDWLQELVKVKSGRVTNFIVLAAVTWAHVAKARLSSELDEAAGFADSKAAFANPSNWAMKKKLFARSGCLKEYFGNAVALAMTELDSPSDLVAACDWDSDLIQGEYSKLADIAEKIIRANENIDENFVLTRTKLFMLAPDIRHLGLTIDSRAPQTFWFNTWSTIGHGKKFCFPRAGSVEFKSGDAQFPDAIRRVQAAWALPHALILPVRVGREDELELVITMSVSSLDQLEKDANWMKLVDRVIG